MVLYDMGFNGCGNRVWEEISSATFGSLTDINSVAMYLRDNRGSGDYKVILYNGFTHTISVSMKSTTITNQVVEVDGQCIFQRGVNQ
jgi:hypothetical protein